MIWVINNIISCSFSFFSSPGNFFFRHSCTEWLTFCALAEWIVYSPIRFMNITTTSIWMATVQSLQNHFVIIRSLTTSNANTNHDVSICVCAVCLESLPNMANVRGILSIMTMDNGTDVMICTILRWRPPPTTPRVVYPSYMCVCVDSRVWHEKPHYLNHIKSILCRWIANGRIITKQQ